MAQDSALLTQIEHRIRELQVPLAITLWNGRRVSAARNPAVNVTIRSPRVLASFVNPTMGKLARYYVEEDLDVEGETREVIRLSEALSGAPAWNGHGAAAKLRRLFAHSRAFDSKSIRQHYDVGDDFYALWLDRRRVYSCGYFKRAEDTLDTAQEQKLDHICRKLMLKPGERFLDIGCGWGALILWAAQRYRVKATGITLSENQYAYARARIAEEGLEDLCEVKLLDYRDVPEDAPFDKIASVGMFEHVGRKNLPIYFAKIFRLLKAGGLVLNHGITLNAVEQDEIGGDIGAFIDEYVFPGGELAHISRVIQEMAAQGLESWDVESLRSHYARTLWHWVDRLEAHRDAALQAVGEKVYRIWRIYMAGSAHAFERGWMSIHQVLAGKATEEGRLMLPSSREYIYAP
ncbi:MAG TPA: class I SAM-dependent methyltransferase [Burkholderiales bacterium]|nr:class I SAM-dependent methyltransferase [Burkholderiales bacterium]